ncbi:hypothetical protein ACFE04_004042 [Oxalis oulophora]
MDLKSVGDSAYLDLPGSRSQEKFPVQKFYRIAKQREKVRIIKRTFAAGKAETGFIAAATISQSTLKGEKIQTATVGHNPSTVSIIDPFSGSIDDITINSTFFGNEKIFQPPRRYNIPSVSFENNSEIRILKNARKGPDISEKAWALQHHRSYLESTNFIIEHWVPFPTPGHIQNFRTTTPHTDAKIAFFQLSPSHTTRADVFANNVHARHYVAKEEDEDDRIFQLQHFRSPSTFFSLIFAHVSNVREMPTLRPPSTFNTVLPYIGVDFGVLPSQQMLCWGKFSFASGRTERTLGPAGSMLVTLSSISITRKLINILAMKNEKHMTSWDV